MSAKLPDDLSGVPMLDLFRAEAETQAAALTSGLLELERKTASTRTLEALMRAAHSLKGAARLVSLREISQLAHAMEDCFDSALRGRIVLEQSEVDILLRAVDLLLSLAKSGDGVVPGEAKHEEPLAVVLSALRQISSCSTQTATGSTCLDDSSEQTTHDSVPETTKTLMPAVPTRRPEAEERVLRLTAENLNRLLGLAGESLVESRWLRPFSDSLHQLKRHHVTIGEQLDRLRQAVEEKKPPELIDTWFCRMVQEIAGAQSFLEERVEELDGYDRRAAHLSQRLYLEVLRTRMRPFSEGVRRFPRMVRDLSRSLQKQVRLEISGESTQVDRDILERLETPLGHLIRNAVDHGCESPEARRRAGKPEEAVIRLDARPSAGVLLVSVSDDGSGIQQDALRRGVVSRKLVPKAEVEKLSEAELLEFLFLPGFTLKQTVTEISGRGYGLDIVQNMVRNVRGAIRLYNQPGRGLRVQLQLPLTLSVLRALLVEVAGEPYAIPLNQISRTMQVPVSSVHTLEGRNYLRLEDQQLGIVSARHVLESSEPGIPEDVLSVVLLGDRSSRHGLVVDKFLGERELVVQPLPSVLGKIKGVTAAALVENSSPVLILDLEEMLRTVGFSTATQGLECRARMPTRKRVKRILVVDDSSTVRQLEQRLLIESGYAADVASDGVDAWSAVRNGDYDLVITDLEMPRMDGLELAKLIKQEPDLKRTAVLIISYKDREEDRLRGMKAGADYYLTKGSFHDRTLLKAVADLIGESEM